MRHFVGCDGHKKYSLFSPVSQWYAAREGKSLIHFGASAGYIPARMAAMYDTGAFSPRDAALNRRATPDEQKATEEAVRKPARRNAERHQGPPIPPQEYQPMAYGGLGKIDTPESEASKEHHSTFRQRTIGYSL